MPLALYRKYRPGSFGEVVGQEHVTDPLQQAIRNDRIHHAYLFSGPRGCGKTTCARVLARSLNCEQGPTPTPCGVCDSCVALAPNGPGSIDVIEIDAASHGGVDDARELRERAFFSPVASRFKIYIIDEAHMVSKDGFNALLKLVEEPPEHVKLMFCTTEPEKVIGTIRSRTHHYPFRLIAPQVLRELLTRMCADEGIVVEPTVLPLVVRAGAGSARDSLSVLDQLLAGADERGVSYKQAVALLGYTDESLIDSVVDALAASDGATVFETVDQVIAAGHDPRRFAADLLERLRDLVVLAAVPEAESKGLLDAPRDQLERMRAQADRGGAAALTRSADVVSAALTEMRGATSPRLLLELMCARLLLPEASGGEAALAARLDRLERRMRMVSVEAAMTPAAGGAAAPAARTAPPASSRREEPAERPEPVRAEPAAATGSPDPGERSEPAPPREPAREDRSAPEPAPIAAAAPEAVPPDEPGADDAPGTAASGAGRTAPVAATPPEPEAGPVPDPAPEPAQPVDEPEPVAAPPAAAAEPAAAPPAPGGGIDVMELRRIWPQVLEAVKSRRRFAWMVLDGKAQVAAVEGNVLRLSFARDGDAKGFTSNKVDEVLHDALAEVLGVDWRVEAVAGGAAGSPPAGSSGSAAAPAAAPAGSPAPADAPAAPAERPEPQRPRSNRPDSTRPAAQRADRGASSGEDERPPFPPEPPPEDPDDGVDLEGDAGVGADGDAGGLTGLPLLERELGARVIDD